MPKFGPISRRDLIATLRRAGFEDRKGSDHAYMVRNGYYVRIPNPHNTDIPRDLLRLILRQGNITREEWERL